MYFSSVLFHRLFPLKYVYMYSISLMEQENYNFLRCSEKSNFKKKMSTGVILKKSQGSSKEYVRITHKVLNNEKHFLKVRIFFFLYLQNYLDQLSFPTFHHVYSNSKELSYLSWQVGSLTGKLLNISSRKCSCEIKLSRTNFCEISHTCFCGFNVTRKFHGIR